MVNVTYAKNDILKLRPSIEWFHLLVSAGAVAIGLIWAASAPHANAIPWMIAILGFSAFGVFVTKPLACRLILTENEFTVRRWFETASFDWTECSPFQPCRGSDRVHFDYRAWSDPDMRHRRIFAGSGLHVDHLDMRIMDHQCLPVGFSMPQAELYMLMNEYRKSAMARAGLINSPW